MIVSQFQLDRADIFQMESAEIACLKIDDSPARERETYARVAAAAMLVSSLPSWLQQAVATQVKFEFAKP